MPGRSVSSHAPAIRGSTALEHRSQAAYHFPLGLLNRHQPSPAPPPCAGQNSSLLQRFASASAYHLAKRKRTPVTFIVADRNNISHARNCFSVEAAVSAAITV